MLEFSNNALHDQPQIVRSLAANPIRALYVEDRDFGEELALSRVNALRHTAERLTPCTIGVQAGFLTNCDSAECNNCPTDQSILAKSLPTLEGTQSLLGCLSDAKETGHGVMTIDAAKPQTSRDFWSASSKRNYEANNVEWPEEGRCKRLRANNREAGIAECPPAEYCSGNSDLTAEHMAEGGSQTSSLEDGCTLTLDSVKEPVSNEFITPERRHGLGIQFPIARAESVDTDLGRKRERVTTAYRGEEERQFRLEALTGAVRHADEGYQGRIISRVDGSQWIAEATATTASPMRVVEKNQPQTDENEDDWLQLGLGRTISKQSTVANQSGSESTRSRVQPEKMATLELLSQTPDRETITVRGIPTNSILNEEHLKRQGKLMPFVGPVTATVRLDAGEISPRVNVGSLRESREQVDPLFPQPSPSYSSLLAGYCDLPIQISACVPLLSGAQRPFLWQDEIGRYAGPTHRDPEGDKNLTVSSKLPGYAHASYYPTSNSLLSQTPADGRSNRATRCQDPFFPEAAGDSRFEKWQQRASGKALPTWSSFHDPLAQRISRNSAESSHCTREPGMPVQHHTSATARGPQVLEEWPKIMKRFSTNLSFQNPGTEFTLLDRRRSIGAASIMPTHEMTTQLQQAIDRYHLTKSQDSNDRNMVGFRPSWLAESLLRSDYAELSAQRMYSLGSDPTVGERSHCERAFLSPSPLSITANIGSTHIQEPFSQSFSRMKRITKPRRGPPGFWFALQAKETQHYGRLLPQIPKSYIRIKDGATPISIVKKYLVSKLGLSSESEVEITCRGKELGGNASLEDVRDEIWFRVGSDNGEAALNFDSTGGISSSSEEFVMILTYGSSQRIH